MLISHFHHRDKQVAGDRTQFAVETTAEAAVESSIIGSS